ncbi:unnamed protein product [Paramecium pentaurelia]|uniref:Uncharacterized protein n=1 Tax=Paramecium pentaurelia TaxID=43138 RepID=A0A8S1VXF2_9CILI|nr:unnamed protein product [Paramecium pentaurelia]
MYNNSENFLSGCLYYRVRCVSKKAACIAYQGIQIFRIQGKQQNPILLETCETVVRYCQDRRCLDNTDIGKQFQFFQGNDEIYQKFIASEDPCRAHAVSAFPVDCSLKVCYENHNKFTRQINNFQIIIQLVKYQVENARIVLDVEITLLHAVHQLHMVKLFVLIHQPAFAKISHLQIMMDLLQFIKIVKIKIVLLLPVELVLLPKKLAHHINPNLFAKLLIKLKNQQDILEFYSHCLQLKIIIQYLTCWMHLVQSLNFAENKVQEIHVYVFMEFVMIMTILQIQLLKLNIYQASSEQCVLKNSTCFFISNQYKLYQMFGGYQKVNAKIKSIQ